MTVDDLLEQAKSLSPQERQELAHRLLAEAQDDEVWTDDEIAALLTIEPLTGREIVEAGLTGGWRDMDIGDGAAWVDELRRKRKERRQW